MEIKLILNTKQEAGLQQVMNRTGYPLNEVIEKSLALFDLMTEIQHEGGDIFVRQKGNTLIEPIRI